VYNKLMPGEITFRWLGVAGFSLQMDGFTLAVDPFFTRPPLRNIFGGRPEPRPELAEVYLPACEAILVTHAHHDHLMDAPGIARRTGARLYGSHNTCRIAQSLGLSETQTRVVLAGDEFQAGPLRIGVTEGKHPRIPFYGPGELPADLKPPLRLVDYRMDADYSFRIAMDGWSLLNWAGVTSGPAKPADVLVCGATKFGERLKGLLAAVQPRLVIPTHWDDLFRPLEKGIQTMPGARLLGRDAQSFARRVQAVDPRMKVWIPELFGERDLVAVMG
jgi:L-ascorbate metabolism protein UlaG (beta-lactamase superfamily)